jgi:PAS domain S-box-containing protein
VFIHQASVALQKRRAEEELKRSHDQQTLKLLEYERDLIRAHEILEIEIAEHRYTNRELMKQQQFAHLCYSLMDIAVIGIDRNGRILHSNSHASALLGYPATEMAGRGWSDSFVPPPLKPDVDALIEKVAQGGFESVVSLKPTITADGSELEMIWLFKRVKSEKDSKTRLLLMGERPPGAKVVALYRHLQAL